MTGNDQSGLADFGVDDAGADDDRPEAEAAAVAGDTRQAVNEVVDAADLKFPDAEGTVDIEVTQVDYTVEGNGHGEYPVVHVFGRRADGKTEHARVLAVEPYFYVPTAAVEDRSLVGEYDSVIDTRTENAAGEEFQSIRGTPLTKVVTRTPRDVGRIRDDFEEHYEADILFPNRFLIDKDVGAVLQVPERRLDDDTIQVRYDDPDLVATDRDVGADLRVNTFDIEVDDRRGFPEEGEEPILCLTSHDSYRDEYVVWLFESPDAEVSAPESLPEYDPIVDSGEVDVRVFEEEAAMLDAFVAYVDETDPDVLTGWNCLPADSELLMADGTTREIQDIEVGDDVVGANGEAPTTTSVTNKWKSEKEVLEFTLADGTTLRSSEEHRIMVGDDDSVDWKEGEAIEPGDFVLKPRKLRVDRPSVPMLGDLVPESYHRFSEESTVKRFKSELPRGAVTELSEVYGLSKGTLYHPRTDVWTPSRCSQAADRYDVPRPDGGVEYRRNGVELDRQLTEHELYLAGLITTDGSMSTDDGIRFYNTREELHEQFPGGQHLVPDGEGCCKQNVLDYALMHAFNNLGIPFGNKNAVEVDLSPIYEMPEEYIARFLAGAIDGDGSVSSSVSIAAANESLGDWYVKLFKRLGIYATRNKNVVRVPNARRDLTALQELVLPHMCHSEKVEQLAGLTGGKSGQSENIPYCLFEAETGSDEKRIGRDKHRRGVNLKRHETTIDAWEEFVFVRVRSVDSIGVETTYDIETETHNFVAEDCLVHNCEDFDIPYVLDRLERLDRGSEYNLDYNRFSRVNEVWRSDWGGPDVKGRVVFDLLYGYKKIVIKELESFRLDAVGERELAVGKEHYQGSIGDLWEQDPERLLEYNLRDVELCVEIDRKQAVVAFWDEVRSFVGCKLEDAPTAGDAVDMYVLHKAFGEFALPSKGQQEATEEFEGGAVFEPITGVKENVTVLDLKSLYPMSMATINSSPETKVDPEAYDGDTYRAPNGTHFRKRPDGIMREMIDELLSEREEKKRLRDEHKPGSDSFEQYDRQQGGVKVIMNCFTPDTDVLTPSGVRNIRELAVGDEVYSLDPDSMKMEVKQVEETHAYPDYEGELVDIETSKVDFRVTPNHRMLVRKNETNGVTEDGYSFVEAGDLDRTTNYELPHDWTTDHGDDLETVDLVDYVEGDYEVWVRPAVHGHTFAAELGYYPDKVLKNDIGEEGYVFDADEFAAHREYIESVCERSYIHREANRKWIPRTFDGDDFLDLLAWYVTEGNVDTSEDKQFGEHFRGSATTVKVAQDEPAIADGGVSDHAAIGALLDRVGFDYFVDDRSYQFTSRLLGETLERLCGGNSFEKEIPELVFDLSERQKRRFLDSLIAGDGDRRPNSWRYTTSSERLRDGVLRLSAHLGLTASYGRDSGSWRVYVTEESKNTLRMHRSSSNSTADEGVYCVTVADNHTLLAGRNGKFQFVGQSLYGVSGWERFRLYDTEGAAAVTATGREVINFTETAANELDYEVAYGDTDSVMLSLGPDVSKEEALEQSFEIEEYINERYGDFANEELNAEDHRFQIEFEKLYRRFFQAGKKKRYAGHIVWKEGKDVDDIDITGFEYKRSDIAAITKRVQKEVIEMIVHGDELDDVKEYVHGVIEEFQTGNVDPEDVGIPGGIGKRLEAYDTDTAQVRGAKYANLLLGTNFQRGSKPKRLYLKKVHPEFFREVERERGLDPQTDPLYAEFKRDPDVICFEYAAEVPDSFEVDWDKMLEKTLKGPIERIIEALDLSWDEVKSGQEQTGLGQWS